MSVQSAKEDDVALKILHSADWHLGMSFPAFDEADRFKLTRARLNVVDQLFNEAEAYQVDAVLCAGDLFDEPNAGEEWWKPLLDILKKRCAPGRSIVLLPGNHDPLTEDSVYAPTHPFRRQLPAGVHVVDRNDFSLELGPEAILYAVPCRSRAGASDPTELFPPRTPGDRRIRLGMAHGQTMDMPGFQLNFPINPANAAGRGLDYLALGDTHAHRVVISNPPVVYPGTPEQMKFDEVDTGKAILVFFRRFGAPPTIRPLAIGTWRWQDRLCRDLDALRALMHDVNSNSVLRLKLEMKVGLDELEQVEQLLVELKGTLAVHGKGGVVRIDRTKLERLPTTVSDFPEELPEILKSTLAVLEARADADPDLVERAKYHLIQLVKQCS